MEGLSCDRTRSALGETPKDAAHDGDGILVSAHESEDLDDLEPPAGETQAGTTDETLA